MVVVNSIVICVLLYFLIRDKVSKKDEVNRENEYIIEKLKRLDRDMEYFKDRYNNHELDIKPPKYCNCKNTLTFPNGACSSCGKRKRK